VQKVLTKHFKTLILKVAFVIIRRLQKPHYSQKQKSNKNKNKRAAPIRLWQYLSSQGHNNNRIRGFLLYWPKPGQQKTNPKQQKSQTKRHPSQGVFLLP
jgi:hypothetical protein